MLLTVTGDGDRLVRDVDAKRIFNELTQVPGINKSYVTLVTDEHGKPALKANHLAPVAWAELPQGAKPIGSGAGARLRVLMRQRMMPDVSNASRSVDALDFYGLWKLFDGLTDAAFYGTNRNYALGDTHAVRFMGVWSDGVPVKELAVTDHP